MFKYAAPVEKSAENGVFKVWLTSVVTRVWERFWGSNTPFLRAFCVFGAWVRDWGGMGVGWARDFELVLGMEDPLDETNRMDYFG